MATTANDAPFSLSCVGDFTGEKWVGNFRAKTKLSHRDHLAQDRIRRELQGPGDGASKQALSRAEMFSQLAVRLTIAPTWWKEADNGLDLHDENVAVEVYNEALKIERTAWEELQKSADDAKAALAKVEEPK